MTEISKTKWQDVRPSDLKDTGIGGAADDWKKTCTAADKLKDSVLTDAGSKNQALIKAIGIARKALDEIKKNKKYAATKDLLDDWDSQTKAYGSSLDTETMSRMRAEAHRVAAANKLKADQEAANLAAANKVVDRAFEITEEYQRTVNGLKKALKSQVDAFQSLAADIKQKANDLTVAEGKAQQKKADLAASEVASTALKAAAAMERLRTDLVFFRGPGAGGIAKAHNLDGKPKETLGKRFTEHKALMDKIELDCKTIAMLGQKIDIDTVAIQQALTKTWEILPGYQKILKQVLTAVQASRGELSTKTNPGTAMKKWSPQYEGLTANAIELQITSCQMVIDTFRKVEKRIDEMISQGFGHIDKDFMHDSLSDAIEAIETERAGFKKEKLASDKEASEGIAHGRALLKAIA